MTSLSIFVLADAPVYLSFPHFLDADPNLAKPFEGLKADRVKHGSYFKIQPVSITNKKTRWSPVSNGLLFQKLGVPIEGKIRAQLNLKVDQAPNVNTVSNFPSIIFPIMWVEEVKQLLRLNFKYDWRAVGKMSGLDAKADISM